ncbi:hypothetical protein MY10362_002349 [Beauveria mimosiformis]
MIHDGCELVNMGRGGYDTTNLPKPRPVPPKPKPASQPKAPSQAARPPSRN